MHERYRQTTDGRTTTYSKRKREFTFANKKGATKMIARFAKLKYRDRLAKVDLTILETRTVRDDLLEVFRIF